MRLPPWTEWGYYGGPDHTSGNWYYDDNAKEYKYNEGVAPQDGLDEIYEAHDIAYGYTEIRLERGDITQEQAIIEKTRADIQLITNLTDYDPTVDPSLSDYRVPAAAAHKEATKIGFLGKMLYDGRRLIENKSRELFNTAVGTWPPRVFGDPLILDLDGDGTETIGVDAGAYFDHDANGFAEQTGWASPDDGLLVLDRNNNGKIDNGRELFGDNTLLKSGAIATDGLQALADLDDNGDGKIDAADTAFAELKVWQDTNSDGISTPDELHTMEELGIKSLNTTYTTTNITHPSGNIQTHAATYETTEGFLLQMGNFLVERDTGDTRPTETLPVPEGDISSLPDMQGYGSVMSSNFIGRAA